ncbi:conserved exported hypothetical protein [Candidatus Desulfosporosinus infrequens]|uniref:Uncharacterized protein n=1 Tax=Candidatus Desulfosporosinus infrequens TaxID=2043169 RepID=A0A2U3LR14_9FIRM|nr:conserved exported hypothetical protein [Candidatus Desulfosporosinus infrequens]
MIKSIQKKVIALSIIILLLWAGTANAADILTWDNNYSRDRSTSDTLFPYYNSSPIHVLLGDSVGTDLDSYSSPIVCGNTLYMFAWNTNSWVGDTLTTGQLIAVDISHPNPTNSNDFTPLWRLTITLAADGSQGNIYGVPGPSISKDGQFIALAIGNNLYSWPMAENPVAGSGANPLNTSVIPDLKSYLIAGNAGQSPCEIAMTPVISTQSYTWTAIDASWSPVTWQSPVVSCGSWDGGFTAAPLSIPEGVTMVRYLQMNSLQLDPNSASAAFTSSPIVTNTGDIMFGVDPNGGHATIQLYVLHPSAMQDVITGAQQMEYTFGIPIGAGHITNPLPSAPAFDKNSGDIYVQDDYGYVYQFDSSGNIKNVCGTTANGGYIGSVNLAIDGSCIYAAESNGASIDALDKSNIKDWGSIFPGSTGFRNPSVVIDPATGKRIVIANDVNGKNYLEQVAGGSGVTATSRDYSTAQLPGDAVGNDYSSVIADAGPQQEIIAWSPATALGASHSGELVIWPQSVPTLETFVNPGANQPGAFATLYAQTSISNTISTVYTWLPHPDGSLQTTATPMTFSGSSQSANNTTTYTWSLTFTVPNNNTSDPITATIPVQLNYNNPADGNPVSKSAMYVINSIPPPIPQPPSTPGQLSISSYAGPINNSKIFHEWPIGQLVKPHAIGQTYMGDTILSNVTSSVPPPPRGTLDDAYIVPNSATLTHPKGYAPSAGQWQIQTVTDTMAITGKLTATSQFEEDFDGWAPGKYRVVPDGDSQNSMELLTPGQSYPISAIWTLHEHYHWFECVPSGKGCVMTRFDGDIDYSLNDSQEITAMGTDFVIIPIVAGDIYN